MADKDYCLSSYMAFRFIDADGKDFYEGMQHKNIVRIPDSEKTFVRTSEEIGNAIEKLLLQFKGRKIGIMLSGGMDSAIVASYIGGGEAYTFRFLGGEFQNEELMRAEYYARRCNLNLHYVDISWDTVLKHVDACMKSKCAPVHSIEPQILQAALQAQKDGVEIMLIGDGSDYVFGGMDKLLSKDWDFDAFVKRYYSIDPEEVLRNPVDMSYAFEPFRKDNNKIDFLGFMQGLMITESYSSYKNAFSVAGMPYYDPYARLKMAEPLDLNRIRNGEPKYLIRGLMSMRYPEIPIPDKNPMPRPVDVYFADWKGPKRKEFKENLDMTKFTGNQKWQLWCAERFLNMFED
ncbi:MAG: hypothetical protein J5709_01875 [Bacteroidales bacterium]|nr:hypothetical protein [Bacteroidales bacterium]